MDGVIVIGYEDSWMAIIIARGVLLVLDVEWESYGYPITSLWAHCRFGSMGPKHLRTFVVQGKRRL